MQLLDSPIEHSTPQSEVLDSRVTVIAETDLLYQELLSRVDMAESLQDLNDLSDFVSTLKAGAEAAWEALSEPSVFADASNARPISLCNPHGCTPALEGGALYIPEKGLLKGEADARETINSWSAQLSDVQSRILDATSMLDPTHPELPSLLKRTSTLYSDVMFFLSNDPDAEYNSFIRKAETVEKVQEFLDYISAKVEILRSLKNFDTGSSAEPTEIFCNPSPAYSNKYFSCYTKWMNLFSNVKAICMRRLAEIKKAEEDKPYEL